jgi:hypothetical protein
MKNYIVYDRVTGEIRRTGSCPDEMMPLQSIREDEVSMEGSARDDQSYVKEGKLEDIPAEIKATRLTLREETDRQEVLIRTRMISIVREQAIKELQKEGKIEWV